MAILFGVLGFLIIPETYAPVLLTRRAKRLRKESANMALRSPRELENLTFRYIIEAYLLRPFKMLLFEPILMLLTIYMGFIFGSFVDPYSKTPTNNGYRNPRSDISML